MLKRLKQTMALTEFLFAAASGAMTYYAKWKILLMTNGNQNIGKTIITALIKKGVWHWNLSINLLVMHLNNYSHQTVPKLCISQGWRIICMYRNRLSKMMSLSLTMKLYQVFFQENLYPMEH